MFQPASTRDSLVTIARTAVYQGNLLTDSSYVDTIPEDLKTRSFIPRPAHDKHLQQIAQRWGSFLTFWSELTAVNAEPYKVLTRDFRNASSHAISPRFEFGEVGFVKRSVVKIEDLDEHMKSLAGLGRSKNVVSYAFGSAPPLSDAEVISANQLEPQGALRALQAYEALLLEIVGSAPAQPHPVRK